MRHLDSIRQIDEKQSHWTVKGPAGRTVEWDAVIHNEIDNELIAWRSLPGADVDNAGTVMFREAPGGRGTEIRVELQYNPPVGVVGAVISMLWGEEPGLQIQDDLRHLKEILEAGEILTTQGQPTGRDTRSERRPKQALADEASEQSF